MIRLYILTFIFFILLSLPVLSQEKLKIKTEVSKDSLETLSNGKINFRDDIRIISDNGNIFFISRQKNEKFNWHIYNPYSKKIINEGDCPFKDLNSLSLAVSPNGFCVFVYSYSYNEPYGVVWFLDVKNKKWETAYKNSKYSQNASDSKPYLDSSFKQFTFVNDRTAYAVAEVRNRSENTKEDTQVVAFTASPLKMRKVFSFKDLEKEINASIAKEKKQESFFKIDPDSIILRENDLFLFKVIDTKKLNTKYSYSELYRFSKGACQKLTSEETLITPLDLNEEKILYGVEHPKNYNIYMIQGGNKTLVLDVPVMRQGCSVAGSFLKDGKICIHKLNYGGEETETSFQLTKNGLKENLPRRVYFSNVLENFLGKPEHMKQIISPPLFNQFYLFFIKETNTIVTYSWDKIIYYELFD